LTGNSAGIHTGDVTGNLTGKVTGDVTGNLTGDVTGDITGNLTGDITGNLTGDITGNLTGDITIDNISAGSSGKITANADICATAFIATSDGRLKKDVTPIEAPLDKIHQIRGVHYKWKSNDADDTGVIAQEVQAVLPDVVHTKADGYLGVDYSRLVSLLIESVKGVDDKIDAVSSRVDSFVGEAQLQASL
jgi:hypothetical protein